MFFLSQLDNSGEVLIMGPDDASVEEAIRLIQLMVAEVEIGEIYRCAPAAPPCAHRVP